MIRRAAAVLASIVVFAAVALLPLRAEAQLPAGSTRMVDVMGTCG